MGLPDETGTLMAVRREQPVLETWAGDPEKRLAAPDGVARLHPRKSFDLYRAERRGRAAHWSRTDRKRLTIVAAQIVAWRACFDAARRETLIHRLRQSEGIARRLAVVAERANDAVIITEANGATVWVNAGFTKMTGYTLADMAGCKPGHILQGPGTDPETVAAIARAISAGEPIRTTVLNYHRNGNPFWLELDIAPIFDADGKIDLFIAIERDVTEAREREARLAAALEQAETSSRLKADFLRMMSHEVRTPLNGVLGTASILRFRLGDTEHTPLLDEITRSGQALLSLFDSIIDLSQAVHGDLEIERSVLGVSAIVGGAMAAVARDAEAKGLSLRLIDDGGNARALISGDRLRQVLDHLLSNAVKFTASGGVTVTIAAPTGADCLTITVHDTGPGVPEAEREAVFSPFHQCAREAHTRLPGTGVSLALSRRLVECMGGQLDLDASPDGGAAFLITLPLAETATR